jgi:hypothetical protein
VTAEAVTAEAVTAEAGLQRSLVAASGSCWFISKCSHPRKSCLQEIADARQYERSVLRG